MYRGSYMILLATIARKMAKECVNTNVATVLVKSPLSCSFWVLYTIAMSSGAASCYWIVQPKKPMVSRYTHKHTLTSN